LAWKASEKAAIAGQHGKREYRRDLDICSLIRFLTVFIVKLFGFDCFGKPQGGTGLT
jgi:hypothetical protein